MVHIDALFLAAAQQVALAFAAAFALKGFDCTFADRKRGIGHRLLRIDADHASKAATGRTSADWVVERKERRRRRAQREAGGGIGPIGAEAAGELGFSICFHRANRCSAFAQGEGRFHRFEQAAAVGAGERDAVLKDIDRDRQSRLAWRFVGADDRAIQHDAQVTLLVEEGEKFRGFRACGCGHGEGDQYCLIGEMLHRPCGGASGRIGRDEFAGVWIVRSGCAGEEQLEVIVDLGERADG